MWNNKKSGGKCRSVAGMIACFATALIIFCFFYGEEGEGHPLWDTSQQAPVPVTAEMIEEPAPAVQQEAADIPEVYVLTPEDIEEERYWDSLELLALCVEAEAGNQDLTGKRMVADVILNRVDDVDWPDTVEEVIAQPYEFSSYWNGAIERAEPSEETFEAVRMELEQRGWPGLRYFTAGNYSEYGTPWKKVGDHYFSTK